jgi:hypothetical protein
LHRLDADAYSSQDVVVLTIPISLPYPIHEANYERADGELMYHGEFYHLVKQKVENDTLFMVCVKDLQQKRLEQTINEYTNLANNLPASTKHTMDLLGKLFKDYTSTGFTTPSLARAGQKIDLLFALYEFSFTGPTLTVDSPPPERS